jgi:hypothetical protein
MLAEAEAAIVKRIKHLLEEFEVTITPFPGDSEQVPKPGRKGQVFIGYKRSRFRVTSMLPATCEVIAEYELSLQLRDLRSHSGAYPILDAIRYAITGFIPLKGPSHKCYPVQEGFVKAEDGIWYYALVVAVAMQQIEGQAALYTPISEDGIRALPGTVPPFRPDTPIKIRAGIRRSKIDNLQENILDEEFVLTEKGFVPVNGYTANFGNGENSFYIELI